MQLAEFRERIRTRLSEIGATAIGVAVEAGLPRDAIRSVLKGHPPNLIRADDVCRALGITLTIGGRGAVPQPTNGASDSGTSNPRQISHNATRAEHFAQVVDGQLADLFAGIAETYDMTRSDGERRLVVFFLSGAATSAHKWMVSAVEWGDPPLGPIVPLEELSNVVDRLLT